MRPKPCRVLLALVLASFCAPLAASPDEAAAIARVLDDWHDAAAKADEPRYFGHMAKGSVFLGTDAKERWTVDEFRAFAHPYFAKGKAWSFAPKGRHVILAKDGATAWFDELLETEKMGLCRGSGVVVREDGRWKVALYDLSIPIPNELAQDVVKKIAAPPAAPTPAPTPVAR